MVTRAYRWIVGLVLAVIAAGFVGQVVMAQDANAITFETVGTIEAMDTASITIHSQLIDITGAEIKTALEIGLAVKVQGTLLADGRLAAREVDSTETGIQPNEGEFIITWPGAGSATFIIGGVAFDISNAEIENGLVTGDLVRIHATLSEAGVWIVREVSAVGDDDNADNDNIDDNNNDNADDNDNGSDDNVDNGNNNDNTNDTAGDELEFTGTLEEVGTGFIRVSGAVISTVDAEIKGELIVGALVKVHASTINGQLVAREVELAFQNDNNNDDNDNGNNNDNGNDNSDNGNDNVVGTCPPTLPAGWTTYTIQPGDTLSSIASRADTSLENLIIANCIDNPRLIVVGSTIFVPRTPDPISDNDNVDNNNDNDDDDNGNDNDDNGNDNDDNGNNNDDGDDDNGNDNDDDDDGNGNGNDNENRSGDDDDD